MNLLYKCNLKDFDLNLFHNLCNNISKLLILIKTSDNEEIGGYADVSFNKNNEFIKGNGNSFLFSLTNKKKYVCVDNNKEIYAKHDSGPIFGAGFDL